MRINAQRTPNRFPTNDPFSYWDHVHTRKPLYTVNCGESIDRDATQDCLKKNRKTENKYFCHQWPFPFPTTILKGIAARHFPLPDSIRFSNSRLPGHHSPTLWHWMLIILILLIHVTTRQQWNASWQSKRRRSGTNSEHSHCDCRSRNS